MRFGGSLTLADVPLPVGTLTDGMVAWDPGVLAHTFRRNDLWFIFPRMFGRYIQAEQDLTTRSSFTGTFSDIQTFTTSSIPPGRYRAIAGAFLGHDTVSASFSLRVGIDGDYSDVSTVSSTLNGQTETRGMRHFYEVTAAGAVVVDFEASTTGGTLQVFESFLLFERVS